MAELPSYGTVGWVDLTVPDAEPLRDFYQSVIGWHSQAFDMGGYSDFVMLKAGDDKPVSGICHARGPNEGLPPVWLVYFNVASLDASLAEVTARNGRILKPATTMAGHGRYAIIVDPSGAPCALFEPIPPQ